MWLIIGLAVTFSVAAAVWVGSIARENVLEQHVRRLSLETDQLSSDLGQALAARLDAIDAAGRILRAAHGGERPGSLSEVFERADRGLPGARLDRRRGCGRYRARHLGRAGSGF